MFTHQAGCPSFVCVEYRHRYICLLSRQLTFTWTATANVALVITSITGAWITTTNVALSLTTFTFAWVAATIVAFVATFLACALIASTHDATFHTWTQFGYCERCSYDNSSSKAESCKGDRSECRHCCTTTHSSQTDFKVTSATCFVCNRSHKQLLSSIESSRGESGADSNT